MVKVRFDHSRQISAFFRGDLQRLGNGGNIRHALVNLRKMRNSVIEESFQVHQLRYRNKKDGNHPKKYDASTYAGM